MYYKISSIPEWGNTENISEKNFVQRELDICAFPLVTVPGKHTKAGVNYCIIYMRCVRMGKW